MSNLRLRHQLKTIYRYWMADTRSLLLVWRAFRWSLAFIILVWGLSTLVLHEWYPLGSGEEPMTWGRAAYYVLMMTAFEAALEFHVNAPWSVKAVFFALPLLGLFVIIDTIVRFTGLLFQRRVNKKEWQELLATTYKHHVVVCGLGHVGYRIVEQLKRSGTDCVAIELKATDYTDDVMAMGIPVILGDASRIETLKKAMLPDAEALIAATNNDLLNIETALNAREIAPKIKIVLRLFDQTLAKKIEKSFSIDAAFSPSAIAAPVFAAAATTRNVINSFVVEGMALNTVELLVREGSKLAGKTLDALRSELEVTILLYQSGQELDWNPGPERVLMPGTKLLVVTTLESLRILEYLNEERSSLTGQLGDIWRRFNRTATDS
ncbi:Voltage-gated potassium channel Kch [compost metagenome]